MKILQETLEKKWQFTSMAELSGVIRRVPRPSSMTLLLHGLNERGKRIYRKLLPYLPQDTLILAPNGPFPIQRTKEKSIDYGHSWYFYDKFKNQYFINQNLAKYWLRDLLAQENKASLPVIIIGFSQGGYLAPVVASEIKETQLVIGLSCEFKSHLIAEQPAFSLHAVHGDQDEIISMHSSLNEIKKLREKNIPVHFHLVEKARHEITSSMGKTVQNILREHGKRSL